MIKTAAACLGGSGAALIPIHTSSLFRNSCSSRPPSKPSFPTFSVLWSVFPRFKVWPKRRWKKFTFTGRDLARARSLHATAGIIVSQYGGKFPQTRQEVLKLKGIGSYTVASFLALAFNQPETVVDGNVIRIICRLYNLTEPVDEIAGLIRQKAEALTDRTCPADYASAIMDLGAGICTPKNPQCLLCPWQNFCRARGLENLENIPRRKKSGKKEKTGFVYLIHNNQNEILIRQRTEKGLLSGLYEFPWSEEKLFAEAEDTGLEVSHVFTHIKLTLRICLRQDNDVFDNGRFVPTAELSAYPFSTLMKKVYQKFSAR